MLLTLLMNLNMFGPITPSGGGGGESVIKKEEGGRYHEPKDADNTQISNNNKAIIAISELILNRN